MRNLLRGSGSNNNENEDTSIIGIVGNSLHNVAVDNNITTEATYYYPSKAVNSSITTSVTIHVTPQQYHLMNWGFLWGGFIVTILFASWQIYLENKNFKARMMGSDGRNSNMESPSNNNIHVVGGGGGVVDGEHTPVSSSDLTRSRVSNQ